MLNSTSKQFCIFNNKPPALLNRVYNKRFSYYSCLYDFSMVCSCAFVHESRKLLSGRRLNNFLKPAFCLSLVKCFEIFHFNWNFWKSSIFHQILPSVALKYINFADNFDFMGKTAAKFLMRSHFLSV